MNRPETPSYRSSCSQERSVQVPLSSSARQQKDDLRPLRHRRAYRGEDDLVGSSSLFQPELQTLEPLQQNWNYPTKRWMPPPSSESILLHDLGPKTFRRSDDSWGDDDAGRHSESTSLLKNKHQPRRRKQRQSLWYQYRTSRTHRRDPTVVIRSKWSAIGSFWHQIPSALIHKKLWNSKGRYSQISSPSPMPTFISEERFWLILARFFGLTPIPQRCRASFPTRDELKYITNYLLSKPTLGDTCGESDEMRNLVKVCVQLTRFIFRNPQSRKTFLGLEQGSGQSQLFSWAIFQSFGAIEQWCNKTMCDQDGDPLSQYWSAWLHTDFTSRADGSEAQDGNVPTQHCRFTSQVWHSLWILLKRARKEGIIYNRTTRLGLRHIYIVLSATDVNSPGQLDMDFSQFCPIFPAAQTGEDSLS